MICTMESKRPTYGTVGSQPVTTGITLATIGIHSCPHALAAISTDLESANRIKTGKICPRWSKSLVLGVRLDNEQRQHFCSPHPRFSSLFTIDCPKSSLISSEQVKSSSLNAMSIHKQSLSLHRCRVRFQSRQSPSAFHFLDVSLSSL